MTAFLSLDGVRRSFGDVTALDGVSLDVAEGEFFALLGPSGCGKTTLLRILAGFETPDSGTVTLAGEDLTRVPAHQRPVNLMFQSYALFPHLSVEKNIAYGLHREGLPKAEITQRVGEVLERVGLAPAAKRRPHQLSGGQRQRVALARAIVKRPRLLLLDEPLSALDRKVRAEMQLWLKQLQHEVGITFVVVTHDQEEAMSMADRIAVLHQGAVEQVDSPVALYGAPRTWFVADFIGGNNFFSGTATEAGLSSEALGQLPGTTSDQSAVSVGEPAVLAVRPEQITLNDGDSVLSGTVLDVSFYGGTSRIAVEVPGHGTPVLVHRHGAPVVVPQQAVDLSWGTADAVLVPPSSATAASAAA
ncbi:spermidine/putrescine transport system ATP-binding protein/putrescine transport system ATP-binding protein [Actinoplanes lutulentus]|uniref:Spermidine/putrescine import ATP-binding protein PotA n=1 Tax=Actinoplanes lutulentus TaxID=1287878 RepID=A0A327YZS8_9ACTN|nr:ABC transporter ATP-binding protein [Actinoplanes lutulentus]MBB2943090.1 spermidine/putrescine transport system ATP-binding protein/putrescine transport system ATP-binding protein [Actinoplanes lutulentus]RAK26644.1 spermidine/putrescine transport system ATP-binding protein/putrescine transport system ATP-binding protein [Actinoplanes lutulentus]